MEKQLIISIGREFGSGGHVIAEALAKKFNIPMYDHNLLDHIAAEKNLDLETLKAARKNPELYPDLQVRLCGWNELFSGLKDYEKDEFIARAAEGE